MQSKIIFFRTANSSWHEFFIPVLRKAGLPADRSDAFASPSRSSSGSFKHKLTKYGDEFVQDSHLFPFSPVQISDLTDTLRICIKFFNGAILPYLRKSVKNTSKCLNQSMLDTVMIDPILCHMSTTIICNCFQLIRSICHGHSASYCLKHLNIIIAVSECQCL